MPITETWELFIKNFSSRLLFFICFCFPFISIGQSTLPLPVLEKYTVSGTIKDSLTGETLMGATIWVPELSTGTATNEYGYFSLTLLKGNYSILISSLGHRPKTLTFDLNSKLHLTIELSDQSIDLSSVEVNGEKENKNVTSLQMSANKLEMIQVKMLPSLFGETDILRTLGLLPGVQTVGEGNTGFYVRGGGADQNLILLDEATIYNAAHLLGFFSIFNSDAIQNVTLYKGGIPAEYGGRLSSVLDVRMKDGNSKRLSVKGGIGLIASRLTIEGPIGDDKGSFIISGRRTYGDLIFRPFAVTSTEKNSSLYFYDLNLKATYKLSDKDRLFLSGYYGKDVFIDDGSFGVRWGNATGTLAWNHIFNDKLFLTTSAIANNYNYKVDIFDGSDDFSITSAVRDYALKTQFDYFLSQKMKLKFGANSIFHTFEPGTIAENAINLIDDKSINNRYGWENAVYISDEYSITPNLSIIGGLRLSSYFFMGPGKVFTFDSAGTVTDTMNYKKLSIVKPYYNPEPRLSARYLINDECSFKASYMRTAQYIQLLSNTTSALPTDLWIPSTNNIKPQLADQYAIGYFRNYRNNMFETSVEMYYKNMYNQIDYKPGADLILNPLVESQLDFGKGRAYGIEFLVKKNKGKFTGWVSYTYSRTELLFNEINNDTWYPARQDRPNNAAVVLLYDLNPKWTFSTVWVYATGNAVTFPIGKYEYEGQVAGYYSDRNAYRMPDYNRLDISITYHKPHMGRYESNWIFSVYNVYDRHNAYSIDFQQDPSDKSQTEAVETWLFGTVPSITYDFKF